MPIEVERQLNNLFTLRGVKSQIVKVIVGPTFTRYEASVDPFSFRTEQFIALEENIAHLVHASEPPIIYPIYERSVVAIDILNQQRSPVYLEGLLSKVGDISTYRLPVVLGSSVQGQPHVIDLVDTPHMLVAGATGSGKSVGLRSMLTSLIYFNRENTRLLLIDPKAVEMSIFSDLQLAEVITDMDQARDALHYVQHQVNARYEMLRGAGVSNVAEMKGIPYLVVVIDELADLLQHDKMIKDDLLKIVQKSRAAGIHLIAATQRPSVDIISGIIKNNFPARMAFKVSSSEDSRVILGNAGAEKLLGQGDMLYRFASSFERLQGAMITNQQITTLLGKLPSTFQRFYKETGNGK